MQSMRVGLSFSHSPISLLLRQPLSIKKSNAGAIHNVNLNSETLAIKFLGVYFDPSLNFKFHINFIMKKLSRALFFMRTAKNNLTVSARKSLFYSLFHSNIYGIHVWSCASPSTYACIFLKQKMSIRLIFNASYNIHTASLFKKAAVLPLVSLIEFFCLQFIQRFLQRFLPVSFNETWVTDLFHRQDFQIELRNDADLYIPFARTALIEHQPLTKFPKL
jgi:hypothetical protein